MLMIVEKLKHSTNMQNKFAKLKKTQHKKERKKKRMEKTEIPLD